MNRSAANPNANEPAAAPAAAATSRNMICTDASAAPPHHRRRASLLDAASALASLGGSAGSLGTARSPHAGEGAGRGTDRAEEDGPRAVAYRGDGDGLAMTFPEKLMDMLSNEAVSDIITWLPNGKGFVILMKRRFAEEVLPLYFKQSKYTSFTRKLNRWGFQRMTTGPEIGAYSHPNFERGNHLLCFQMHCTSKPPSKSKASAKRPASPAESRNPSRSPSTHEGSVKSDVGPGFGFDEVLLRQRQHLRALHLSSMQRMEEESARAHGRHGYNRYVDAFYGGKERQSLERGTLHDESSFSYQRTPKYEYRSRHSELELGRLEFAPDGFKQMSRGQSVPPKKRHHEHNMAYKHSLPVFNARERRHLSEPTGERTEAPAYSSYQDSLQRDVLSSMRARLAGIYESNKRTEAALKIDKQTDDALKNDKRAEDSSKKTDSLYSVYWSELGKRRVFSTSPVRSLPSYKKNVRRASAA
ncbi:hypothetical protein ACHAXT_002196 [Thalassiosira profunda]